MGEWSKWFGYASLLIKPARSSSIHVQLIENKLYIFTFLEREGEREFERDGMREREREISRVV